MYKDYRSSRVTGLNALPFDPATNNDPLQFSSSSGPLVTECPPLETTAENSKKRKRASLPPEGICNMTMDSNSMTMPMSDPNAWATAMNNLGMPPIGITGQQLMPDFDPSLGMMAGITPLNPMMPGLGMVPAPLSQDVPVIKEIIHCKSCTLFPPNPNLPPPATRDRPPGCKTVFVGGLPENATEQLIMEVFGQCGDITAIRKSKKNFCHIRFAEEFTVDKALFLSGYRIRLGSSTDKKDTGRLHVDFAQARDDLYEWECRQRMLAREERHRRKMEEDRLRPPSPPPIVHYSEHECSQLGDKIKDDAKFPEAVRVLLTWLERGEVNRRNANNFYSMIQSSNGHIRRLTGEKSQHEKEMEEAKEKFKTALSGILGQFEQIVSVFQAASKQKAWDHFSKAQRKNLDMWRKQAEEIRNMHNEQLMGIRREEEMEMSDDDMEDSPDSKDSEDSGVSQAEALKEENDSLRCQLDAYRNEVELLKQEQGKNQPMSSEEDNTHSQQLSFLQQALQGMQKQLLKMREELKQREAELEKSLEDKQQLKNQVQTLKEGLQNLQNTHVMQLEMSTQDDRGSEESANQTSEATVSTVVSCSQEKEGPTEKNPPSPVHSEREALLVGIISTFLHVHPFGASIEYICSYLQRLDTKINTSEVEALLSRLPCTFRQELTGVGASLEKRWNFCGFQGIKST
ncbi:ecto-NOX disulfide-thiol exchanger 2-like isoform X2 [Epinephelus fuscoguttatus]|uniref:ecto-NOX disulfide-thiol exchanger 2 isoform X1 n=1 Tax=Epinephelus lanceolatus TaxID=310571 RepID=UPI0014477D83|nr:ecto-NOX disulfide-thiol exchanger 2 isoform X1 [Epinephelus lanceolatus]XP_033488996.1 ecto-NOX disulfide-thiol exchanger 2 isoform X1 [Epinephelus lanceolatus]XP_033488997.1 ecto-NOX disulfide-thiol exchanger 2 isoform X1 [Epinephelus lanceolatus]XP_049441949.1 ecto-NOX disulfide-thiol exchanger 2-like isoform X2 [Epinephelus fuscoguttatus]XP_049441950.1 ecto-NOX disulfide-thiol exchanger 2-like isoform X2 [Epinephelus fuscoguttatus]XP_049897916.1 ecto-NOX disulfide-thiol exchanger 2-like